MKTIITIQHTQSEQHINGMIGSWSDWELTELGKLQAENIVKKLSYELVGKNCKIYCSDLLRAKQTAEPLAKKLKLAIEYCKGLREINYGEACGKSKEWARANKRTVKSFDIPEYNGGESWRTFWNRVKVMHNKIITDNADYIIVVSHGGTLKVWQEIWKGSELTEYTQYGKAGDVSFFKIDDAGKKSVLQLNDNSYSDV